MDFVNKLEFNIVKDRLKNYASMFLNKEKIDDLELIKDKYVLEKELKRVDEASTILKRYGRAILSELNDIYKSCERASKGFVLSIDELYDIKSSFTLVKENKVFAKEIDKNEFKEFHYYVDFLDDCPELNNALIRVIDDNKMIKDTASSELSRIRKEIKKIEGQIKDKLLKLINVYSAILVDTNIVYKNGKQVLAVQSAYKNKLGGIVVDESNSGYTSYVEPEEVYQMTSKINSLKNDENEEIQRILRGLSMLVNKYCNEVRTNFECLLGLDFMFAKGEYCNDIDGKVATISDNEIVLVGARNPLIDKEIVVSNTFYLGKDNKKILIISGPNTGGKSVALKTVGILAYMNECGLPVSVDEEAKLPIFDEIYVDIGDNQSIISSLSTFSSHVSNISFILNNMSSSSLVLLDEVGAGTDPKEGEALAMAIVDYCHDVGCFLLSSTHYENLKTFALNSDYITVASMEFDKANLKPTYKLLINQIGKSYALEISRRYGITKEIIDKAKSFKEKYATENELTLEKLEQKIEEQDKLIKEYEDKNKELNELITINKNKELELENEILKIKEEAKEEIEELVKDSKEEITEILKEIKEKDNVKMHEALIAQKKLDGFIEEEEEGTSSDIFKVGDTVKIVSLNKEGKIVSINKNKCMVDTGKLTLTVNDNDLEKTKINIKKSKVTITSKMDSSKMKMELNLIGKRVEEAINELEIYLDRAKVLHFPSVRIIHGFGTGRLQKGIHEYLKTVKNIEYHFGGENDGGYGSTTVIFKK